MQPSFFDFEDRWENLRNLNAAKVLVRLNSQIDWEVFRAQLETIRPQERKSNAGRKPFDVILMFKIMVLQSLYNLSDEQAEFQIKDRMSFMQFLGLNCFEIERAKPGSRPENHLAFPRTVDQGGAREAVV